MDYVNFAYSLLALIGLACLATGLILLVDAALAQARTDRKRRRR